MKNVLLTTLSVSNLKSISYYYSYDNNSYSFCNGLSQQEFGSKYILANNKVDTIVVITSKETEEKIAPYYEKAIRGYISGKASDMISDLAYGNIVPKERRETFKNQIEDLVVETIRTYDESYKDEEINYGEFLAKLIEKDSQKNFINTLRRRIEELINFDYSNEEQIKKYIDKDYEISEQYKQLKATNFRLTEESKKVLEETLNLNLSIVEQQYLFTVVKNKILAKQLEMQSIQHESEVAELMAEIEWLNYRIRNLETDRINKTLDYAKYFIFSSVDEKYNLRCSKDNKDNSEQIKIVFVRDKTESGIDNVIEITNAIKDDSADGINIFIDIQGGARAAQYLRNEVISMLSNRNDKFNIVNMIGAEYNYGNWFSKIVDEKERYMINDFVSGISSFINYGKSGSLRKYYDSLKGNQKELVSDIMQVLKDNIREDYGELLNAATSDISVDYSDEILIDTIVEIDHAVSLCNVDNLINSMKKMACLLINGVKKDEASYNKSFYLELIKWCYKKEFYQQALTLIESKIPIELVRKGIICYCNNELKEKEVIGKLAKIYESKSIDYRTQVVDYFFIKLFLIEPNGGNADNPGSECIFETDDLLFNTKLSEIRKYPDGKPYKHLKDIIYKIKNTYKGIEIHCFQDLQKLCDVIYYYFEVSQIRNDSNHANGDYCFEEKTIVIEEFIKAYSLCLNKMPKLKSYCIEIDDIVEKMAENSFGDNLYYTTIRDLYNNGVRNCDYDNIESQIIEHASKEKKPHYENFLSIRSNKEKCLNILNNFNKLINEISDFYEETHENSIYLLVENTKERNELLSRYTLLKKIIKKKAYKEDFGWIDFFATPKVDASKGLVMVYRWKSVKEVIKALVDAKGDNFLAII